MEINELRIGNLLRDKITKTELTVTGIGDEFIQTYVIDRSKYPLPNGWQAEPIPLTEEVLLSCGAKEVQAKRGVLKEFVLKTVRIEMSNSGNFYYKHSKTDLQYLHRLQNLFHSLRNEELQYNHSPSI